MTDESNQSIEELDAGAPQPVLEPQPVMNLDDDLYDAPFEGAPSHIDEQPHEHAGAHMAADAAESDPTPAHFAPVEGVQPAATPAPSSIPSFLDAVRGSEQPQAATSPESTEDLIEAARVAAEQAAAAELEPIAAEEIPAAETPSDAASSPADTADLTEAAAALASAEAAHTDPGSTQSFSPITDEMLIDTDSTFDAGTTTQLMWGARSDVGCVRNHNEDSYLAQSPLFAVCDGMGGHAAGEVASSIAVETIAKTAPHMADPTLLARAVEAANAAVIEAAVNGMGKPGMGCTATCAYIEGNTIAIAHVGDSRAYLLHEGTLIRVTHDHSYVEELVEAGEITADEARVHPNRSVITRALGSDPAMYADHFALNIEEGDRLILCSDGLSSMIPDGHIEQIATQSSTAQICVDNLVDAALAAGGADNCTVVVVDVVDDGRLAKLRQRRMRNLAVALIGLAAAVLLGAIVTFLSITGSVYLGVHNDAVAIYTGVPSTFAGIKLHWLEDVSTVSIEDLPEDTQHRLAEGIPQESLEQAAETISKYRKQIEDDAASAAAAADAVRQGTDVQALDTTEGSGQ